MNRTFSTLPEVVPRGLVAGTLGLTCAAATPADAGANQTNAIDSNQTGLRQVILQPGLHSRRGPPLIRGPGPGQE